MQRFTDCVLTRSGAAVAGASVLVKTYPGGATATIYSDDGETEQSNPMTSDANGKFSFYAADGRYTLVISKTGYITQQTLTDHVLLQDLEDADADHASAADVHFTPSGTGATTRDVQDKLREIVSVKDFGAAGDGTTDDTDAIQAAIDALDASAGTAQNGNRSIFFPAGTYNIDSTILPANSLSHYTLLGEGKYSSRIQWTGSAGSPMFKLRNARGVTFKSIGIVGDPSAPPSYGIEVNRTSGTVGSPAPSGCCFEDIFVGGDTGDSIDTGIGYTCDSGSDANNDRGDFVRCEIANCTNYGVRFEHLDSLNHEFHGCAITICGVAAISNLGGANSSETNVGGSFTVYGGRFGQNASTFELSGAAHNIAAYGSQSETDDALITMPNSVTGSRKLNAILSGMNWKGTNGTVIKFDGNAGNTLDLIGCSITTASNTTISCPTTGSRLTIQGGHSNISTVTYNNEVVIKNHRNDTGTPTYTNSGSGVLITDRGDGANTVNTLSDITSGTTFSASGRSTSMVRLNYSSPGTISTITDGYVGQILTLYAQTANTTIAHGSGATNIRLKGNLNVTLAPGDSITVRFGGTASSNTWVEIGRKIQEVSCSASAVGNSGTGEDNLKTDTIPANWLASNGKAIRVTAWGTYANNANAKTLKLYVGSQVSSQSLTANEAGDWEFTALVVRTGVDAQAYKVKFTQEGTTTVIDLAKGTLTEDDATAITVKCTGEATSNNDIVQEGMLLEFLN